MNVPTPENLTNGINNLKKQPDRLYNLLKAITEREEKYCQMDKQ